MPNSCDFEFDHPNNIYCNGEIVNGKVRLITQSPKTIRGIHITINGYGKVQWTASGKCSKSTTYTARDQYLNSRTYVSGQENGHPFELAGGIYDYTFYCQLPLTVPSSMSAKYGEIKYEVIVTIDRPYRFDDVFKREFTIIQEFNLNLVPLYRNPKNTTDEKEFSCTCCFGDSGTVNSKFSIPSCGYVPGQKINYSLEVVNESAVDLKQCTIKLEKCITFKSTSPFEKIKYSTYDVDKKHFPQILRNARKQFDDFLVIPLVPPSSIESYPCVRISYNVCAVIKTGCFHKNILLSIPIAIGTKPFENATNVNSMIAQQSTVLAKLNHNRDVA